MPLPILAGQATAYKQAAKPTLIWNNDISWAMKYLQANHQAQSTARTLYLKPELQVFSSIGIYACFIKDPWNSGMLGVSSSVNANSNLLSFFFHISMDKRTSPLETLKLPHVVSKEKANLFFPTYLFNLFSRPCFCLIQSSATCRKTN